MGIFSKIKKLFTKKQEFCSILVTEENLPDTISVEDTQKIIGTTIKIHMYQYEFIQKECYKALKSHGLDKRTIENTAQKIALTLFAL